MKRMRKIPAGFFLALAALSVGLRAQPSGAQGMDDPRRTLFAVAGQQKLTLEAPLGMCFLDRTQTKQAAPYAMLSDLAEKNHDQVLLGAFMNCSDINNADIWRDGLPAFGLVTWMNPSIGAITAMSRQDYLDMRESYFPQYAKNRVENLTPEKNVHRNGDNVSLGMAGKEGEAWQHRVGTVVISTTTLNHVPVEFTLHYAGDGYNAALPPKLKDLYYLMDKFVAQQIALNL